jgi:hypothetical protein
LYVCFKKEVSKEVIEVCQKKKVKEEEKENVMPSPGSYGQ